MQLAQTDPRPISRLGRSAGTWAVIFFFAGLAWLSLPFAIAELHRHRSGRWRTRVGYAWTAIVLGGLNLVFFAFLISAALIYNTVFPHASPGQRAEAQRQIAAYQAPCEHVRPPFPKSCPQAGNVPAPAGSEKWNWNLERGTGSSDVDQLNGSKLDVRGFWYVTAGPPGTGTNQLTVNMLLSYVFHFEVRGSSLMLIGVENKDTGEPAIRTAGS